MIKKLKIENYKSLHDVEIDLPRFAVFVGANAAGKSNLADALEFLSIAVKNGLPVAVSDKGGYENICFRRARRAKGAIRFTVAVEISSAFHTETGSIDLQFEYTFAFKAERQSISAEYTVLHEMLKVSRRASQSGQRWQHLLEFEIPAGNGRRRVDVSEPEEREFFFPPKDFLRRVLKVDDRTRKSTDIEAEPRDNLLLITSGLRGVPPFSQLCDYLASLRVFQIMPSEARQPASASGTREMGKHGSNLPAALQGLKQEAPESFEALLEHLRLAVPSVEGIETSYVETRQLGLFLKEDGMARQLYSSELSDGTVRTIGLFLPLVDPRYQTVVIEEPENSVHPWVVREFVSASRRHSLSRQILLTTHSPTLVSQLNPEELYVVGRKQGQTEIRAALVTAEELSDIVGKGLMDLGAYWDSGAMGGVPSQLSLFDAVG